MRVGNIGILAGCAVASLALPLLGQSAIGSGSPSQRTIHPYTARFQTISEQTLANGTTITRQSTEIRAVDSEGRRLTITTFLATERSLERTSFHVFDPVARTNVNWTVPGKSATVRRIPPPAEPGQSACWTTAEPRVTTVPGAPELPRSSVTIGGGGGSGIATITSNQPGASRDEIAREDLGKQTIQGVEATGTRTTRTTPVGAIGNDAPLVRTSEVWMAKSLGLVVREVSDDPQTGKRNRELVELSQSEPDPSSFQPPEGYNIMTEEMHQTPCQQ